MSNDEFDKKSIFNKQPQKKTKLKLSPNHEMRIIP